MAQTPTTATTSRVREVTAGFSKSHDVDTYFADEAEYDVLPLGQHYQGKEQIKGLFQVFYQDAFSPARAEIQNVIADAGARVYLQGETRWPATWFSGHEQGGGAADGRRLPDRRRSDPQGSALLRRRSFHASARHVVLG